VPVVVTLEGGTVVLPRQETGTAATTSETAPNPILPVGKEMVWGFGSFLVLFVLMRFWLFPKVRKGMDARYAKIRADLDASETARAAAASEAQRYEEAIATARAEANDILDAARRDVEADRSTKVNAANARIAERRAVAAAETDEARRAALAQAEGVVVDVATAAAQRVLGQPVDRAVAERAVAEVVHAGAAR
jgi:F-type H+-transporting ATPase subunit b